MERIQRYDLNSGQITGSQRTATGGRVASARITRTGVLSYKLPGGATRKEYRPPEEVFAPASLATLANATLTDDHPGKVTPQNWRRNTIGHVAGDAKPDGKFVAAELHLQHDDAIDKAEDGELSECSCGYDCDFDPTPGKSPEGEAYDGVQRNIRYNHVALGPPGWGRAGREVSLRLDAATAISGFDNDGGDMDILDYINNGSSGASPRHDAGDENGVDVAAAAKASNARKLNGAARRRAREKAMDPLEQAIGSDTDAGRAEQEREKPASIAATSGGDPFVESNFVHVPAGSTDPNKRVMLRRQREADARAREGSR